MVLRPRRWHAVKLGSASWQSATRTVSVDVGIRLAEPDIWGERGGREGGDGGEGGREGEREGGGGEREGVGRVGIAAIRCQELSKFLCVLFRSNHVIDPSIAVAVVNDSLVLLNACRGGSWRQSVFKITHCFRARPQLRLDWGV